MAVHPSVERATRDRARTGTAIIGITTYLEPARWGSWLRDAALLPSSYLGPVERAGAIPVLLPPASVDRVPDLLSRLDGLILSGGSDVDPELYGAARHAATSPSNPPRDRFELAVVRHAIDIGLPFLAICRGLQILNVARDGTLVQHLPDLVGHAEHQPALGRMARHPVRLSTTSTLGRLLGTRLEVATYHHQAIERLGKGLLAVAWADDQVVEAVELQGHPFGIGVQWHPEEDGDPRLFEALVAAAEAR